MYGTMQLCLDAGTPQLLLGACLRDVVEVSFADDNSVILSLQQTQSTHPIFCSFGPTTDKFA
jgi:hypothetical protein